MVRYSFGKMLTRLSEGEERKPEEDGISIMTTVEFQEIKISLPHRKTLIQSMEQIHYCKAEAFGSCTMGTIVVPDKKNLPDRRFAFGFYLTEHELILIEDGERLKKVISLLKEIRHEEGSGAGSFLIFLMDYLIRDDVVFLQKYEEKLAEMEEKLLDHLPKNFYQTVIKCRKELLTLHTYYEQLIAMGEELESNDNQMFTDRECNGFDIFASRASRLHDHVEMLREYVLQIREMYQSQIDINQNRIMSWLTVVTTIFLPLSLLAGWYGMNFRNMPELGWTYSYPVFIFISIGIVIVEIWFFKKKKFL